MATMMAPDLVGPAPSLAAKVDLVAPQCDLTVKSKIAPVYQFPQQFQSNTGASITLSNTGPAQSIWNLPGDICFNNNQSSITFDLNLTGVAAKFSVIQTDVVPIDSIYLQTVGGNTPLAALQNVQTYCKNMRAITNDLTDYLAEGPVYANTTVAGSYYSQNVGCQPTSALLAAQAATVPGATYMYSTAAASAAPVGSAVAIAADSGTDKSYIGKQRLAVAAAVGTPAGDTIMRYRIPFKAFVGTMLASDQDVYMGQNFQIVINWSATNKFVFSSDAAAVLGGTFTTYTGAASLTNLYINLAKELNGSVVQQLREQYAAGGIEMLVPYTVCNRGTTSSTGNYSYNMNISSGMGLALKRILNVPVRSTDQDALANCNDNVNAHLYTQVQSFMDAQPIQPQQLNCGTNNQDYWYMQGMLKNVPAGLSLREFQINSFWLDNFSDNAASGKDFVSDDCTDSGYNIGSIPKNYNVVLNVAANTGLILYQYVTFVRKLLIRPSGIQWAN